MFKIAFMNHQTVVHPLTRELESWITERGYQFVEVTQSEALTETLQSLQPDSLLIATHLESGGLPQDFKNLRETALALNNLPIVMLGPAQEAHLLTSQSLEAGAADFISLEEGKGVVIARVNAAIKHGRLAQHSQELNQANAELYERNMQVEKELYVARQLQQSLLPPFLPEPEPTSIAVARFAKCHFQSDALKITGVYLPCDSLGGDMYDVIQFHNGAVGVAIADVSGHGVPAGFITAIFKSSFYRITHNHNEPSDIMFHLNNELADIVKTGDYVTAFYGQLQSGESANEPIAFDYTGAGHPYPLYYSAETQQITLLKENATPLVWVKNMDYPPGKIQLHPGDKLLLFTDGVSEMKNNQGELYGEEALQAEFLRLVQSGSAYILDELIQTLSDFTDGHPLEDDVSIVLIEAK